MLTVRELHSQAMHYAFFGDVFRSSPELAQNFYVKAASKEEEAFHSLHPCRQDEPSRCILGLSAASLWWQARKWQQAIDVIRAALPTATPFEHRELVDLMRQCEVARRPC